jgi:HsdM N-terminal domain
LANRKLIFQSLSKKTLVAIALQFNMRGMSVLTKDQLVEKLYRKRSISLIEALKGFTRNELNGLCVKLGFDDTGTAKKTLIERILGEEDTTPKKSQYRTVRKAESESSKSLNNNTAQKINTRIVGVNKRNKMAKKATNNKTNGFEQNLWDTANKLRGSVESSEYKHVVLSLIFLRFASDKFEERKAELIAEGKAKYLDMVEIYTMKNVFYLPEASRWTYISSQAKQDDLAIKIDTALATVEKNNKALKRALPDNYFSRLGLDGSKLAALIDTISNIDTVADKKEDVVGRVYEYFLGKLAAAEGKGGGEF